MRPVLLLALFALCLNTSAAEPEPRWWKGNLHTHSLWSDGDDYPEMIAAWYKERGYHFLALSDHNVLSDHERWIPIAKNKGGELALSKYVAKYGEQWVERREVEGVAQVRLRMLSEFRTKLEEAGRFLMIQSEEITARYQSTPIHINATNIREFIAPRTGNSMVEVMQNNINAVKQQREKTGVPMFPHINHPNFGWAITAEELMQLENERFFEVYNGHPQVHNEGDELHASTDRIWDIILTERLAELGKQPLFGLAVDDSHHYHNEPKKNSRSGRGWVMVRSAALTPEALIAAMEAGDFYASSGVTLKNVSQTKGELVIEIDGERGVTYRTEFIGTRRGYDRTRTPILAENGMPLRVTQRYSKDIGTVLSSVDGTSARYALKGDEIYVRARITSSRQKADPSSAGEFEQAWTQPLVAAK
ncbi:MAG TPA: hypothetical protein VFG14_18170 [Chthoniobacteraceae bacterium]|nr:hypothetical protein [Chthoniobacteraceae bacterium]